MSSSPSLIQVLFLVLGIGFFFYEYQHVKFSRRTYFPLPILFLLAVGGCDKNQLTPLDSNSVPPFLSNLQFNPDSVYIDSVIPSNGQYSISTTVRVKASDSDGLADIASVFVDVIRSNGTVAVSNIGLGDKGVGPDSLRGDGVFSGTVTFTLTRAQAGRYEVRVRAIDKNGSESNSLVGQLRLARRNASPVLLYATTPDTIDLPTSGYVTVQFTASASDSDGLADIRQVFFRRLNPVDTTQTRFFMKDDGSLEPPVIVGGISVGSGDDIAGDGRFSFLVPLLSTTTRRTNLFGFQAIDSFGDTSATVQRYFTVR